MLEKSAVNPFCHVALPLFLKYVPTIVLLLVVFVAVNVSVSAAGTAMLGAMIQVGVAAFAVVVYSTASWPLALVDETPQSNWRLIPEYPVVLMRNCAPCDPMAAL